LATSSTAARSVPVMALNPGKSAVSATVKAIPTPLPAPVTVTKSRKNEQFSDADNRRPGKWARKLGLNTNRELLDWIFLHYGKDRAQDQ
jgi:hypothetical protein